MPAGPHAARWLWEVESRCASSVQLSDPRGLGWLVESHETSTVTVQENGGGPSSEPQETEAVLIGSGVHIPRWAWHLLHIL